MIPPNRMSTLPTPNNTLPTQNNTGWNAPLQPTPTWTQVTPTTAAQFTSPMNQQLQPQPSLNAPSFYPPQPTGRGK
jgi:hypothetical protein